MRLDDNATKTGLGDSTNPPKFGPEGQRVIEQYGLESEINKIEKAQSAAKKAGEAQIMSQYGSVLSKPYEEFKPSQESASGFAALGSLLMVAGGMMGGGGRMAGIGAMNNIAGMMKGYQQGRKDLYEQERTQFEENMKVFEKNRTLIKEAFDRALKMAPYNLTTAQNNLRKELQSLGASIPAEMTAKSGLVQAAGQHETFHANTTNTLQKLKDKLGLLKAEGIAREADIKALGTGALEYGTLDGKTGMYTREQILSAQQKGQSFAPAAKPTARGAGSAPVAIIGEGGKPQLITRDEFERRTSAGEVLTPAPRSGAAGGGAVQFRYNTAITNATVAASMELRNIAESPLNAAPPVAAEALTNPVKSITQGVVDYFAQASTPAEDRAVQQMLSGLVRAQTAILGGGRPGGMTEAAINEIKAQAPRSGDSKINTYLFLALGKQVYEVALKDLEAGGATDVQMKIAKEARDEVNRIVPYTTEDINRILRGSGPMLINDNTVNLLKGSGTIGSFEDGLSDLLEGKSVVTPPPASSNVPTGAFKVGDPVVQGGKRYVVKQVDKDGKILSAVEEGAE
jgi:hypothetical protein